MSTATTRQQLSSGRPVADRYGLGGLTGARMKVPLNKTFSILVGTPNSGKSFLLQSNPDAFIINIDGSSTTYPEPKASLWPGWNEAGEPVDGHGNHVNLTWEEIDKKLKQILEMDPAARPKTVIFDSLSLMTRVVQDKIIREHEGKRYWKDLDGRYAWDYMGDVILEAANSLRRAGVGVIFTAHMVNKYLPVGENQNVQVWTVQCNDNLFRKIFPAAEFIAVLSPKWTTETKQIVTVVKGHRIPKTVSKKVLKYQLCVRHPDSEFSKCRRAVPSVIDIPTKDPWTYLETIYNEAPDLDSEAASLPEEETTE